MMPVAFPLWIGQGWRQGRSFTGSPPPVKTIGIVDVAALAASAGWLPPVAVPITATLRRTKSAANIGQSIVAVLGPSDTDRHVPALDIAGFLRGLREMRATVREPVGRSGVEQPDYRHRRLPSSPDGRRCHRRPAEKAHELPAASRDHLAGAGESGGWPSSASALAVLTLMTNSNLVGSWTGKCATNSRPSWRDPSTGVRLPCHKGPLMSRLETDFFGELGLGAQSRAEGEDHAASAQRCGEADAGWTGGRPLQSPSQVGHGAAFQRSRTTPDCV